MKGVLLFLGFLAFAAGHPAPDSRIVDGTPAGKAIPYVVSIQENDAHICGGFIYNDKTVITAASCVKGKGPATLKVSVNDYKFINSNEAGEKRVAVFKIITHEGYIAENHTNDIAVLELAESVELAQIDDGVAGKASCINYDEVPSGNPEGTIAGWGLSEVNGPVSTTLKTAKVKVEDSIVCNGIDAEGKPLVPGFTSSTMICTSNIPIDETLDPPAATTAPCDTDGGAPLVVTDRDSKSIVVGIYIFSGANCDPTTPSVFTRLSVFYAWLGNNAGSQPADCFTKAL